MKKTPRIRLSRRRFLQGSGAAAVGLAGGCADEVNTGATEDINVDGESTDSVSERETENDALASDARNGKEGNSNGDIWEEDASTSSDEEVVDSSDESGEPDTSSPEEDIDTVPLDEEDTSEESPDTNVEAEDISAGEDSEDTTEDEDTEEEEEKPQFFPGATSLDEDSFPLGVQAGSATSSSIHLWTVLAGAGPWRLVVFADGSGDDPGEIIVEGPVGPVENDTAHVDVTYLPSSVWFRYCFVVDIEGDNGPIPRSAIGRFRTAPAEGELEVLAFGGISCNNISYAPFDPLFHAAESALDFFLFAGDTVYADGSKSIEDFRSVWRNYLDDSSYRAIMQSTSTLATWDDHEVDNNWDPETMNPNVIQAATDAFFEHLPVRRDPDAPDRIWRSHRWGKTLEIFVLDCRAERLPSTQGDNGTYISTEQMEWLKNGLADSPCVFKLILNSVPITNMPLLFDLAADDSWVGYSGQREEILEYISNSIDGVVWLAGDFHLGAITHVEGEGSPYYDQMEIFMGPGGQFSNPGWFLLEAGPQAAQYPFATPNYNFVRFIADPLSEPPALIVEFVGSDGDVFHEEVITV